jgi:hypothetical protein
MYHTLTHWTPFCDLSPAEYIQRIPAREIAAVRSKATRLGMMLWSRRHGRPTSEISEQVCAGTPDFRFTMRSQ